MSCSYVLIKNALFRVLCSSLQNMSDFSDQKGGSSTTIHAKLLQYGRPSQGIVPNITHPLIKRELKYLEAKTKNLLEVRVLTDVRPQFPDYGFLDFSSVFADRRNEFMLYMYS